MRGLNLPLVDIKFPIQFKVEGGQYSLALDANNEWGDPEHPQQDAVGVFIAKTGVLVAALADEAGSLKGNGDLARGFVKHVLSSATALDHGKQWHPQIANYDACREAQHHYFDEGFKDNGMVGGSLIIHPSFWRSTIWARSEDNVGPATEWVAPPEQSLGKLHTRQSPKKPKTQPRGA